MKIYPERNKKYKNSTIRKYDILNIIYSILIIYIMN